MSKYKTLDAAIVAAVGAGSAPLYDRAVRVEAARIAKAEGRDEMRVVDGRIQAVRKAGQIKADRSLQCGWRLGRAAASLAAGGGERG